MLFQTIVSATERSKEEEDSVDQEESATEKLDWSKHQVNFKKKEFQVNL